MIASKTLFKSLRVLTPHSHLKASYTAPALSKINVGDLPNSVFEKSDLYHIKKTSNGYWPVYKRIQNTKISTEIKRVDGNVRLFAKELVQQLDTIDSKRNEIKVNSITGQVSIKGDFSDEISSFLDKKAT